MSLASPNSASAVGATLFSLSAVSLSESECIIGLARLTIFSVSEPELLCCCLIFGPSSSSLSSDLGLRSLSNRKEISILESTIN